jgi:VWFA-related protein
LAAPDFILLDNGTPKSANIDVVDSGLAPIALVVLVQTSDISSSAIAKVRKMGSMISDSVAGENGEVAVVTFSDQIDVVQEFTTDGDTISSAFAGLKAANNMGGRMVDAIDQSLKLLAGRPGPRRSNIVVIGESRDRGSTARLGELSEKVQRTGVTVYGLKYSAYWTAFTTKPEDYSPSGGGLLTGIGELARLGKQNTLESMAALTGGIVTGFETKAKLEKDLIRLSKDIHSRYLVSFRPDQAPTPSFHQVSIQVRNHPDAIVRTRPGYWAGF